MSNQDQENLARARRYIQQHDYSAAKSVLKKMRQNPTAQKWLAQIDQIEQRTSSDDKPCGRVLKAATGCVVLCVGLVILGVLGRAIGILPDTRSTATADTAEREAAQSTNRVIEDMTATILALTPSSTPTNTATATIPFTPSPSFTNNANLQNTLPPT
ncbi:MAG: hypothetical protein K8L91_09760 [Anaerolineae bacterium]|nr:hypothetical protein [Anaerolineae bacterium]